jgi:hypothetical protein
LTDIALASVKRVGLINTAMKNSVILLAATTAILLSGCKNLELRQTEFAPQYLDITKRFNSSLSVEIFGGSDGSQVIHEKVPTPSFRTALEGAIKNANLFKSVDKAGGDYKLSVYLSDFISIGNEMSGETSFSVESRWKLTRGSDNKIIWEETVVGKGSSSTFDGGQRTRNARESSVRVAIQEGLRLLSRQNL